MDPSPFESLPLVIEYAHLSGLAVAERVDGRMPPFAKFRLVFQPHLHMYKHDNFIAGSNEPLRLTTSFCPSATRTRQVCLHCSVSVICPASGILGWFDPRYLRVKCFDGCLDIIPVECGVCLLSASVSAATGGVSLSIVSLLLPK